jgi:hypothetical protein
MRPVTSRSLAMRDPAMAAAIGAIPGSNYGADRSGYPSRGGQFGGFSPFDPSHNIGGGFGGGFGVDAPPPPPPPMHPAMLPPPAGMHHGHHGHHGHPHAPLFGPFHGYMPAHGYPPFYDGRYGYYGHQFPLGMPEPQSASYWAAEQAETSRRARVLDPNEHSRLKLERYSFSLSPNENFTLGTVFAGFDATLQPNTRIRAQRVVANAPCENFVILDSLQIANVNVFVGTQEDAWTYNPRAQGVMLDLPTLDPANRCTFSGSYTGLLPANFPPEFSFQFIMTFQGPSTMVGGL